MKDQIMQLSLRNGKLWELHIMEKNQSEITKVKKQEWLPTPADILIPNSVMLG